MTMMKKTCFLALMLFVAACLPSCQPKPRVSYLVPDSSKAAGYSTRGAESVYENKAIAASARQVRKGEVSNELIVSLLEKDYLVLMMTIENRSASKAIYKPNYTALVNSVDYLRPLDYTDLYELGGESVDSLKGKFFDLDAQIPPGGRTTGLLIFTKVSKEAKKAAIEVREFYVGTDTMTFSLPFQFKSTPY